MVAAGFGLPTQKKPVPSMYGPMQSAVSRGFQPGVIAQPNSLQDASLRNGNQEYQAIAPRPNSLADVPASAQAYQQHRQDLFGLNLAANGGIQAQPGPMGPPGSRFPIKPAGPLGLSPPTPGDVGVMNQPNSQGQYNFVTADMRTPAHTGFRPGFDDRPANFQPMAQGPVASPVSGAGQYANSVAQNGLMNNAQAGSFQSATGYMPSKTVGGKFGLNSSQPMDFEKPQFSGQQIADRIAQRPGFFGPNLYNPKNRGPVQPGPEPPNQARVDELFGPGRYKVTGTRMEPTEAEKSKRRNYEASPEGRAKTKMLAENAESTKAARASSLAERRANVVANAKERRALRQERIAQKKNPGVANRFFGNQQDLAMQGLRNQGALGVAQENAKGDIARNEAQVAHQNAVLGLKRQELGLPGSEAIPTGPAAEPLPGLSGGTANTALPPTTNAGVRQAVAEGDLAGAEATLAANGVPESKRKEIIRELSGQSHYGVPFGQLPFEKLDPLGTAKGSSSANDPFGFSQGNTAPLPGAMSPPVGLARKPTAQDLLPGQSDTKEQARAKARLKQKGYGK